MDVKVISARTQLLNGFCAKIAKFGEFSNSEELKLFISDVNDIGKLFESINKPNYEEIADRYKESIINYYKVRRYFNEKDYDAETGKEKLNQFLSFLTKSINAIKVFFDCRFIILDTKRINKNSNVKKTGRN